MKAPPTRGIPLPEPPVEDDIEESPDPRNVGDDIGANLGPMDDSLLEALRLKQRLDEKRRKLGKL